MAKAKAKESDLTKIASQFEANSEALRKLVLSDENLEKELAAKRLAVNQAHKANARERRVLMAQKQNITELLRAAMPEEVNRPRMTATEAIMGSYPYTSFDAEGYFGSPKV